MIARETTLRTNIKTRTQPAPMSTIALFTRSIILPLTSRLRAGSRRHSGPHQWRRVFLPGSRRSHRTRWRGPSLRRHLWVARIEHAASVVVPDYHFHRRREHLYYSSLVRLSSPSRGAAAPFACLLREIELARGRRP